MDGLVTSRLVLGTAQWGMRYGIANRSGRPATAAIETMLQTASDAGVWTLDTARAYGDSEEIIGALTAGDPRWTVVTKIPPLRRERDARAAAFASLEASRRALRRDRLDIVLLHDPADRSAAAGEVWQDLCALQSRGGIGTLGVSAITPDDAMREIQEPSVGAMQLAASLFDQRLRRRGFFGAERTLSTRIFIRSVFLQGAAHVEPDALPAFLAPLRESLERIRSWAQRRGCSIADVFIAYARDVLGHDIVIGCDTPEQLAANLHAFSAAADGAIGEVEALVADLPDTVLSPPLWPRQP